MELKRKAISDLKDYTAKKAFLLNANETILDLEAQKNQIKSISADSIGSAGSGRSDILPGLIVAQDDMREARYLVNRWITRVERGLAVLNDDERKILDRFYIIAEKSAADRLAEDLQCDIKTVYRRKDVALRKFTLAMYGLTDM